MHWVEWIRDGLFLPTLVNLMNEVCHMGECDCVFRGTRKNLLCTCAHEERWCRNADGFCFSRFPTERLSGLLSISGLSAASVSRFPPGDPKCSKTIQFQGCFLGGCSRQDPILHCSPDTEQVVDLWHSILAEKRGKKGGRRKEMAGGKKEVSESQVAKNPAIP